VSVVTNLVSCKVLSHSFWPLVFISQGNELCCYDNQLHGGGGNSATETCAISNRHIDVLRPVARP